MIRRIAVSGKALQEIARPHELPAKTVRRLIEAERFRIRHRAHRPGSAPPRELLTQKQAEIIDQLRSCFRRDVGLWPEQTH
jgi:hypothetical protein